MRLILHAGLHKTGSTYLQHVLMRNRGALNRAGAYFEPEREMNANHSTAWAALEGNFIGISEHLKLARARGADRAILTSEDFEGLLFAPERARGLEAAATAMGVTAMEWHFVLRDPGAYFASLYAELCRHVFIDFLGMFVRVLDTGRLRVENEPGRYPGYWEHCFDPGTVLPRFAASVAGSVHVHDFRDALPYPGHAIVERLNGGEPVANLPGEASRYARLPAPEVAARFDTRFDAILARGEVPADIRRRLTAALHVPADLQAECADAIGRRFAPGMERLLASPTVTPVAS